MNPAWHTIWIFTFLFAWQLGAQTNEGTDFWFSFLEHRNPGQNTKVVMITSRVNTSGVVTAPLSGFIRGFTVRANDVTIIELPLYAETLGSETISPNGFRVESEDPVSVYIHQYHEYRAEATVVLPVSTVGRSYYALSYEGYFTEGQLFPSQLLLVANQDDTNISVRLAANTMGGKSSGTTFSITLNAGETYQIQGAAEMDDLSGSFISADRNLSVFCGNRYTALNCFRSGRDNLLEQAFPVSTWGTQFVSAPFQTGIKDIFRILASEDNTVAVVNFTGGPSVSYQLMEGEFIQFEDSKASFIESNQPILVAQYMNQLDCGNGYSGDPSMLYLNSVLQIRDTVTLYNSSFQNIRENYINIISRTSDTANIQFDGFRLADIAPEFVLAGPDNQFASATLQVNTGPHTITSSGCGVIAKAYGLGDYESYAYSGGASFNKINASPIPDGGCLNDTIFFDTELPEERFAVKWVFEPGDTVNEHRFSRIYDELGSFPAKLFIHDMCFDLYDTLANDLQVTLRQSVETDPSGIFCEGDEIYLAATDVEMALYEWTGPDDYFSEEQYPVISNAPTSATGIYEVIGIVSGCATFPALVNIEVLSGPNPDLGLNAIFCPKDEVDIQISPGTYPSYLWSTGSQSAQLVILREGTYSVTVTDEYGCTGSDSVIFIQQCPTDFYIPNIFSPNGDGLNDAFGIFGEDIISLELSVYDAWGTEVFRTTDENLLWDGNFKNKEAATGVYAWVLKLEGYEASGGAFAKTWHGDVTLIR